MALKHNTAFLSAIMQLKGGTITFKSHLDRKDLERYGQVAEMDMCWSNSTGLAASLESKDG